jgi:hypothetical protein
LDLSQPFGYKSKYYERPPTYNGSEVIGSPLGSWLVSEWPSMRNTWRPFAALATTAEAERVAVDMAYVVLGRLDGHN